MVDWRAVRYAVFSDNGVVLSQPGQLYFADLRAHTNAQAAILYDHTRFPQNPIVRLVAPAFDASDPFPPVPYVTVPIERGVYVSFSNTIFTGMGSIGWNRQ